MYNGRKGELARLYVYVAFESNMDDVNISFTVKVVDQNLSS